MLTQGPVFYGEQVDVARRLGVPTFIDGDTGRRVFVLRMRPPKRRTHAAERTTSTRKGAGSRRNRRTGYAARAERSRAFGRRIRHDLLAGSLRYLEIDLIVGRDPVEEARVRGLLDTLPNGTLMLNGTFESS